MASERHLRGKKVLANLKGLRGCPCPSHGCFIQCWRPGQATVPMCVQLAGMPGPLDAKGRGHWGEDENGQRLQLAAVAHDDSAPHDGDGGEEVMPGCAKLYPQRLLRRQALTTSSTASRTADMEQGTALLRKSPCPSAGCKPSRLFTAIASNRSEPHHPTATVAEVYPRGHTPAR